MVYGIYPLYLSSRPITVSARPDSTVTFLSQDNGNRPVTNPMKIYCQLTKQREIVMGQEKNP
ncbi:hypothetical protein APA386B_1P34 (plasmid) [Acetobacter pasteurianus 386B]|nr:hypothetical protein APA386B_1P34 [Acetobacter pasteurianus 386B]